MGAYIKYSTAISPQASFNEEFSWEKLKVYENKLECIEPNYKEFFPPMKIRRMSRLVRMALTSAKTCIDKAGIEMPDAIISASGWGCLKDTYKYLGEITAKDNSIPSPATFIQSTHNTPGGQIALTLGCQNYNNVIVNGNTSFEYGLIDAIMLINEGKNNILVGGFDEIAERDYQLKQDSAYWKQDGIDSSNFISHDSEGTLPGEGAAFFVVSSDNNGGFSEINNCAVLNCTPEYKSLSIEISQWLKGFDLSIKNIDIVLSGANGDNRIMPLYHELNKYVFNESEVVNYKELCGEYDTSSAFALWLADNIIQNKITPKNITQNSEVKNILIYNYAGGNKHAITLISKTKI